MGEPDWFEHLIIVRSTSRHHDHEISKREWQWYTWSNSYIEVPAPRCPWRRWEFIFRSGPWSASQSDGTISVLRELGDTTIGHVDTGHLLIGKVFNSIVVLKSLILLWLEVDGMFRWIFTASKGASNTRIRGDLFFERKPILIEFAREAQFGEFRFHFLGQDIGPYGKLDILKER